MDCARFEFLLFEGIDREVAAGDRERMLSHEHVCARCRSLAAVVRGNREPAAAELGDAFLSAIVVITSGKPCDRARRLLTSDEAERADDSELLTLHLEVCPDCAAVARALARLELELPALAEADPGEYFVASVMAATLGGGGPVPASRRTRRRVWERLIQRPRLASELAYAVTMSMLLVFGLPSPSLSEQPAQAFDAAWHKGAAFTRVVTEQTEEAAQLGRTRWAELTAGAVANLERSAAAGSAETVERLQAWSRAAQRFARDVWDTLVAPNFENLRSLWNEDVSDAVEPDTNEPRNP